jgi:chromosome segregation ATPase
MSLAGEVGRQQENLENLLSEVAGLNDKKQQRKEKLKQLQEDCDVLDRNIREKKSASVGQTTKKNDLEKEIRELASKQKLYVAQVDELSKEIKSLDSEKLEEMNKITELKSKWNLRNWHMKQILFKFRDGRVILRSLGLSEFTIEFVP